ncbi:3-chloro-4-hydroxyphenylacetate reductive dehalogenase [Anaerolineales bacterium]|nr:3-chloro-4-hydroxyphenylacetate reductive dehalogenase [Anaerolineales bacterium]
MDRMEYSDENSLLRAKNQQGAFPMETIKHVEKPTTVITDEVRRIDMCNTAYGLAARGEYGAVVQRGVQKSLPGKYPLSAAQKDVIDHIALMQPNPVADQTAPIPRHPDVLSRHIKSVGYFLKADVMGTCKVPPSAYYSHDKQGNPIDMRYENAVVIVMRKELSAIRVSNGHDWMGDPISFQSYQHLGMVAETIANYIRRLGWDASAQYGPSFVDRYTVLVPPLLLAAGIGEVSRAGIILNPFLGLAFKAAVVLTDMPVAPDQPIDFGLQRFCQSCKICAEACPSKAISLGDKVMYNGYETWKLNTQRCASFNFTNKKGTMCNACVKSCPWGNPTTWPHNLVRTLVMNTSLIQPIAIQSARLLGMSLPIPEEKWWFDMEYVDGIIQSREKGTDQQ